MPHDFAAQPPAKAAPQKVTAVTLSDDRLPGKPQPKFIYAHHPGNWEFVSEETGFVPRISKVPLRPGINGCRKGPQGHLPVLSRLRMEGWVILNEDGPVKVSSPTGEIVDDHGYLLRYDGVRGATYADVWSRPFVVGAGPSARVDWSSQYDREGWNAWRVFLRESGAVPPPSPSVLAANMRRQERRSRRRIAEAHDGAPHVQAIVEHETAKFNAMREAAAAYGAKVRGRKPQAKSRVVRAAKGKRTNVDA